MSRLRGASKKGVYRVILDGGSTAIVYVWGPREDYWPAADVGTAGRAMMLTRSRTPAGWTCSAPLMTGSAGSASGSPGST